MWDGARNLGDLGGLPRLDGSTTRSGRVWRSAAPEWMTTEGWRAMTAAGVTRVVDLRNEAERGRLPLHPVVPATATAGVEVVHAPTEDPHDPTFLAECGAWLDHPRSWAPNARRFPDKLARVFTAIADSPGPLLIHCAGGRDRTGMVVSMLLTLAEVQHDAIVGFYEAGFRGAATHRGHGLGYDPVTQQWVIHAEQERGPEELKRAIAERRPALLQWVTTIDVPRYLRQAGVDAPRLRLLRGLLAG